MGKPNAYLARQNAIYDEMLNVGRRHGEQYAVDCFMIALHRKGWGYKRIKDLLVSLTEISDYYAASMDSHNPEQDIYRERMDNELRDIVKDNQQFYTHEERYPLVKSASYEKPVKRNESFIRGRMI